LPAKIAALEAELETCKGYLKDAPDHSDIDAAVFQINNLKARCERLERVCQRLRGRYGPKVGIGAPNNHYRIDFTVDEWDELQEALAVEEKA
jgi:hypothetical protein